MGSSEAARRVLSEQEVLQIVQDEIDELQGAIASVAGHSGGQYVRNLEHKVQLLKLTLLLYSS